MCFTRCPHQKKCGLDNPSCNEGYHPGYCGKERELNRIEELNKKDSALYDDAGYLEEK